MKVVRDQGLGIRDRGKRTFSLAPNYCILTTKQKVIQ